MCLQHNLAMCESVCNPLPKNAQVTVDGAQACGEPKCLVSGKWRHRDELGKSPKLQGHSKASYFGATDTGPKRWVANFV